MIRSCVQSTAPEMKWNLGTKTTERYKFEDPDRCFASDSSLMPDIKWCQPFKQLESQRKHPAASTPAPHFPEAGYRVATQRKNHIQNLLGGVPCHIQASLRNHFGSHFVISWFRPPKKRTIPCSNRLLLVNLPTLRVFLPDDFPTSTAPHLDLLRQHIDSQVRICTTAARGNHHHLRLESGANILWSHTPSSRTKPSMRGIRPTTFKLAFFKCVVAKTCSK